MSTRGPARRWRDAPQLPFLVTSFMFADDDTQDDSIHSLSAKTRSFRISGMPTNRSPALTLSITALATFPLK